MEIGSNGLIDSYESRDERKAFISGQMDGFQGLPAKYDGQWLDAYQYGLQVGSEQAFHLRKTNSMKGAA